MDSWTYMTQGGTLDAIKLRRLHDDAIPVRRRRRQRDVTPQGQPMGDIQRTMGQDAGQSKYAGEPYRPLTRLEGML